LVRNSVRKGQDVVQWLNVLITIIQTASCIIDWKQEQAKAAMSQAGLNYQVLELCEDSDVAFEGLSDLTTLDELVEVLGIVDGDSAGHCLFDNITADSLPIFSTCDTEDLVFSTYNTEDRWPI